MKIKNTKVTNPLQGLMAIAAAMSMSANATLITFDDLPGSGAAVPNGYGGLDWSEFNYLDASSPTYVNSGYLPGMVSPTRVAYNAYANVATIDDTPFTLNSAYLTAAWNDNLKVQVVGKLGGITLYDNTYTLSATAATLINFNYVGVDEVVFDSFGGTFHNGYSGSGEHFAMDNLLVNTVVPEPSTYVAGALMLLPFGAKAVRRWKTRKTEA